MPPLIPSQELQSTLRRSPDSCSYWRRWRAPCVPASRDRTRAASSGTKQESGFPAHSSEKMKEFFFYGDSRHTDASGHDHQAQ